MDIEMSNIPVIKELNGIPTLYVEDEPFFAFAGETHKKLLREELRKQRKIVCR